ncbi:hypothetical protein K466DRAFT_217719 [Polyporus arcularius HHB13444]|uniref:F-box domain-containing protein n=1 Tax=Polyporus arcularius HHB13444 TaxID=1314778 RepID=A0A5C3PVR5_9APHY|nr:hypothetical protein K466DRAFT_217719 [Polyporus arcularius HHB13444]
MADSSCGPRPLPPDDLALLSGLQPHDVRKVAESKIQAYRAMIEDINGYIIQLSTIQNTTVPLHASLPPEILMHVFRHILPTGPSDLRLTHVCKLWRDLIFRTPEFWVDMLAISAVTAHLDHNTDSPLSFPSFVVRSSPLPFELDLHRGALDFLRTIPSHVSRIHSLSLHLPLGSDYAAYLTALFNLDMPLLETMRCSTYATAWPIGLTDSTTHRVPDGQKFPRLRKLAFCGPGLPTRAFAFPSLRELKFDDGMFSEPLGPLMDFLESCAQLEVLEMNIQSPARQFRTERDAVSLPHLKIFSLLLDAPEGLWAYDFLEQVIVPATAQMNITWLAGSDHPLRYLIPTSPLSLSVEAIQVIHTLTIRFNYDRTVRDDSKWILSVNGFVPSHSQPYLKLTIHCPCWTLEEDVRPSDALSDLSGLFTCAPSLQKVKLRLDHGITVTPDHWFVILNSFPSLSSLTVRIGSCRSLLTVLRRNPTRWPALRRLSISCRNGSGVHECLLSAIERRAREGSRLEYIAFSGSPRRRLSEHRMRRLEGLVDEVTTVNEVEFCGMH